MNHSVTLFIQPVFNSDSGNIEYAEVLVRKYRGIDSVSKILRFVERNNIHEIFDFDILEATFQKMLTMEKLDYPLSINLCSKTVEKEGIAEKIIDLVDKYNIDYDSIILEINEDTVFDNNIVRANLNKLHDGGIRLALDDFGKGRTTVLSFIINTFTVIKVDKCFITGDKLSNKKKMLNVMSQIFMAMGYDVVIEGVENDNQLDIVNKAGLHNIQGFLFAKPSSLDEFIEKERSGQKHEWEGFGRIRNNKHK